MHFVCYIYFLLFILQHQFQLTQTIVNAFKKKCSKKGIIKPMLRPKLGRLFFSSQFCVGCCYCRCWRCCRFWFLLNSKSIDEKLKMFQQINKPQANSSTLLFASIAIKSLIPSCFLYEPVNHCLNSIVKKRNRAHSFWFLYIYLKSMVDVYVYICIFLLNLREYSKRSKRMWKKQTINVVHSNRLPFEKSKNFSLFHSFIEFTVRFLHFHLIFQ